MKKLSDRKAEILKILVDEYTEKGKPIGSKQMRELAKLKESPATIRNELALLEKEGFLTNIFTSSGRIPTSKGYRYYVDNLLSFNKFSLDERMKVFDFFELLDVEFDEVLIQSSRLISKLMFCVGIAEDKGQSGNKIKHVDLVPLGLSEILVVLISDKGFISKKHIKIEGIDSDISGLEKFINANLTKLNRKEFELRAENITSLISHNKTLKMICNALSDLLIEQEKKEFFYEGTNYIMDYPEVADSKHFKILTDLLGEKDDLLKGFYERLEEDPFVVKIGGESEDFVSDFSMIISGIRLNNSTIGAVGALGPKRINYSKAVSVVRCVADNVSSYLIR